MEVSPSAYDPAVEALSAERARVVAKLKRARLNCGEGEMQRGVDYAIRIIEAMRAPTSAAGGGER